ncbi:YceI family protein [Anaeromyxobacter terrae]|uniref:YceI family protein n=1 Tax=Anaeromyxobacter terrae TaxID=2925406 RepID=UPI001F5ACA3B|nr:YceI family protein [Anaeromyxobacter sp. SG22]
MRFLSLALAVGLASTAPVARAAEWEALPPSGGRIVVHVLKKGFFSGFAHDHHFEVTEWEASADIPDEDLATTSVQVVLSASTLHDRQPRLSESDRRKVDAQASGPDVLDAEHHPQVEFRSRRLELEPGGTPEHVRGTLHGALVLRGQSAPTDVAIEAERGGEVWRVRGTARVKQTTFGIKPFSGFGGTVGVKDELEIEIALTLRRGERGAPRTGRTEPSRQQSGGAPTR